MHADGLAKLVGYPRNWGKLPLDVKLEGQGCVVSAYHLIGDDGKANAYVSRKDGTPLEPQTKEWEELSAWWVANFRGGRVLPAKNPNRPQPRAPVNDPKARNESCTVLVHVLDTRGGQLPFHLVSECIVRAVLQKILELYPGSGPLKGLMPLMPNKNRHGNLSRGSACYVQTPHAQRIVTDQLIDAVPINVDGLSLVLHAHQTIVKPCVYRGANSVSAEMPPAGSPPWPSPSATNSKGQQGAPVVPLLNKSSVQGSGPPHLNNSALPRLYRHDPYSVSFEPYKQPVANRMSHPSPAPMYV